jgi:hypothetical protein
MRRAGFLGHHPPRDKEHHRASPKCRRESTPQLVLVSFMQLYQDRLYALLNTFALHAFMLALSVGWQAYIQDASHLYITAGIALVFKAIFITA